MAEMTAMKARLEELERKEQPRRPVAVAVEEPREEAAGGRR
jgi:hypothetical protein